MKSSLPDSSYYHDILIGELWKYQIHAEIDRAHGSQMKSTPRGQFLAILYAPESS